MGWLPAGLSPAAAACPAHGSSGGSRLRFFGLCSCTSPPPQNTEAFWAQEPFPREVGMGPLLHPEHIPYGIKADPLGPSLCPRGQEVALTPPHHTQGLFSLINSPRSGDVLGGSSVLDEALIIEIIGVREPHRQCEFLLCLLPTPRGEGIFWKCPEGVVWWQGTALQLLPLLLALELLPLRER